MNALLDQIFVDKMESVSIPQRDTDVNVNRVSKLQLLESVKISTNVERVESVMEADVLMYQEALSAFVLQGLIYLKMEGHVLVSQFCSIVFCSI